MQPAVANECVAVRTTDWRQQFLRWVGPGLLGGLTFGRWVQLLRDNHFDISPTCLPRALAITLHSIHNSICHRIDQRQLGTELEHVVVPAPLFVLGHWRNGTTYLHNLLTVDERFAFPNNYHALYPLTFLTVERLHARTFDFFLPRRRPMDNVEWDMASPQEDEFALCISSSMSPCVGWAFPQRREYYDRYLTLNDLTEVEVAEWQSKLLMFLKKVTWKVKRPLILKSPPHTCRIKLLLDLFPKAKFVHIRRNPLDVFSSCRKTFKVNFELHRLQRCPAADLDDWILRQYRTMYERFFAERNFIPARQFHELSFEDLENDPIAEVRRIYDVLALPDFFHVEPKLKNYVDSIANYRKDQYTPLASEIRERIKHEWRIPLSEWGY